MECRVYNEDPSKYFFSITSFLTDVAITCRVKEQSSSTTKLIIFLIPKSKTTPSQPLPLPLQSLMIPCYWRLSPQAIPVRKPLLVWWQHYAIPISMEFLPISQCCWMPYVLNNSEWKGQIPKQRLSLQRNWRVPEHRLLLRRVQVLLLIYLLRMCYIGMINPSILVGS